jgi:phenylalanyl-tRNA synthetase alpha chain
MDTKELMGSLHPLEIQVLFKFTTDEELTIEKVEAELPSFKSGNGNQALSWLSGKGLAAEKRRFTRVFYEITETGRRMQKEGTTEERMLELLRIKPGQTLQEIGATLKLEQKDLGSAFGLLSKQGILGMDKEKRVSIALPPEELDTNGRPKQVNGPHQAGIERMALVRGLLDKGCDTELVDNEALSEAERALMQGNSGGAALAKKRGAADAAFRLIERETVVFTLSAEAASLTAELKKAGITGSEENELTPALLADGSWKTKTFRAYNVHTAPERLLPGRSNPYAQFLEGVKDKLSGLGFEEFDGPLVETEFWNGDALFMPQFHAARDIHDVYRIAPPSIPPQVGGSGVTQKTETPLPLAGGVRGGGKCHRAP